MKRKLTNEKILRKLQIFDQKMARNVINPVLKLNLAKIQECEKKAKSVDE